MTDFGMNWWIWFTVGLAVLLVLDLKLLQHRTRKGSYIIAASWILLAAVFALLIYFTKGSEYALQFITGYLIEKSLSIDNLFVFLMIFHRFHVPTNRQERLLMIGIMGALVMRFIFIIVGISIVQAAHWLLLIFGAFLVITGFKMFKKTDQKSIPKLSWLIKYIPFVDTWEHNSFFIVKENKRYATPAFITICAITMCDLLFALDSIPAIFAITLEPFLVFSCNALAIIGLRSLFFVLKDTITMFKHLHHGVSIILMFVGFKMLIGPWYTINTLVSLGIIALILLISILSGKKHDASHS